MIKFFKQSSEIFPIAIDYDDVLADSETISKQTVTAMIHKGTGEDVTSSVISSPIITGRTVVVKVKNGTNGLIYKITVVIETSANNVYEEDVLMKVREI